MTETATAVINTIVDRSDLPDSAGLRITTSHDGQSGGLNIVTAETPEAGDQVVEQEGARVFLEPGVDSMLDEQVLDASVDDQGRVQFLLTAQ